MDWFDDTAGALADAAGLDKRDLALPDDVRLEILDLARIASHASGERINAPFLCYALGFAVGRGVSLDDLARVIRQRAGE
jgi:uncharacterized protein DUF6457